MKQGMGVMLMNHQLRQREAEGLVVVEVVVVVLSGNRQLQLDWLPRRPG
jgi:hypothetical protein